MSKKLSLLIIFASVSLLGCKENYIEMDKSNQTINCLSLLGDSKKGVGFPSNSVLTDFGEAVFGKSGAYVYDREVDTEYRFSQCRKEIEAEHEQRCSDYVESKFESKTTNYFSPYSSMRKDGNACESAVVNYALSLDDKYNIRGNTLVANGYVFTKTRLTISPVNTFYANSASYFVVPLLSGANKTYLRYGTEKKALQVKSELINFVAK